MDFLRGIAKGLVGLIVLNIVLVPLMVLGPLFYVIPFFCIVANPQDNFSGLAGKANSPVNEFDDIEMRH
jgi:hypothetical protein